MESVAVSTDQRAIIVRKGGLTNMILSTGYTGKGEDFAWIIPTPAVLKAEDVREAGEAGERAFEELDTITAVKVTKSWFYPGVRGGNHDERATVAGVVVHGRVDLENFTASIVSANTANVLVEWLQKNGYAMDPSALPVLNGYIEKRWSFVALKLKPGAQREYANEFLPPVVISYRSPQFVFPLRISGLSTRDEARITLYVVSASTVSPVNYPAVPLNLEPGLFREGEKPEAWVEDRIRDSLRGVGAGLVRMWSGRYGILLHKEVLGALEDSLPFVPNTGWSKEYEAYLHLYGPRFFWDFGDDEAIFPEEVSAVERVTSITFERRYLTRLESRMTPSLMTDDIYFRFDEIPIRSGEIPWSMWGYE